MYLTETVQQTVVLIGVTICGFTDGFIFGQMSGMLSALQEGEEELKLTDEQISWIASIINVTCFVGYFIANVVMEKIGRKMSIIILTIPALISWITVYFAKDIWTFIISRIAAGVSFGGIIMTTTLCTSEYISPNIRAFCVCLVDGVAPAVGTALGHILGILLHWRTVALIGVVPTVLTLILSYFWVESPSWLAANGKYEECEIAFRSLRKTCEMSEKELRLLIEVEKAKSINFNKKGIRNMAMKKFQHALKKHYFWKILALGTVISVYRTASAKILFNTFALSMLQDITGSSDILLFTMLVDSFVVIGTGLACVLANRIRLRRIILPTSFVAIFFLICLSMGLYFKQENNIYLSWMNSSLMALYFIGIYLTSSTLEIYHTEIYPLEIKPAFFAIIAITNGIMIFLSIKFAPVMFVTIGYHGVFFLNAVVLILSVIYLWKYLPETRGRTLQEIELYFKTKTVNKPDEMFNPEQIKCLL